jgi:hypothetical protein
VEVCDGGALFHILHQRRWVSMAWRKEVSVASACLWMCASWLRGSVDAMFDTVNAWIVVLKMDRFVHCTCGLALGGLVKHPILT